MVWKTAAAGCRPPPHVLSLSLPHSCSGGISQVLAWIWGHLCFRGRESGAIRVTRAFSTVFWGGGSILPGDREPSYLRQQPPRRMREYLDT